MHPNACPSLCRPATPRPTSTPRGGTTVPMPAPAHRHGFRRCPLSRRHPSVGVAVSVAAPTERREYCAPRFASETRPGLEVRRTRSADETTTRHGRKTARAVNRAPTCTSPHRTRQPVAPPISATPRDPIEQNAPSPARNSQGTDGRVRRRRVPAYARPLPAPKPIREESSIQSEHCDIQDIST